MSRCVSRAEFHGKSAGQPRGDDYILQHVFHRKVRLEISLHHHRQLHVERRRVAPIVAHGRGEFFHGQTRFVDQRKSFGRSLHAGRGDHVRRHFDRGGIAHFANLDDFLAAGFEERTCLPQCDFIAADVINKLSVFRRRLAPGKGSIEKACPTFFHDLGRGAHGVRRNCAMGHDDVVGRQIARDALRHGQ